MTKYLEFSTLAKANTFIATLDAAMGYPKAETKTKSYTVSVPHPADGRAVCAIDPDGEMYLSQDEKNALKHPSDAAEFFPAEGA